MNYASVRVFCFDSTMGEAVASIVKVLRDWHGAAEREELHQVVLAGMKAFGRTRAKWSAIASAHQSVAAATFIYVWIAQTWLEANQ